MSRAAVLPAPFLIVIFHLAFAFDAAAQWQPPVNLGPNVNSAYDEFRAALSPDARTLLFDSNRPGGIGDFDIYQSDRIAGSWGAAVLLGSNVNTSARDFCPALSADGMALYFTTDGWDMVYSSWTGSEWGARQNLPGNANSGSEEWAPFLSPDGTELYFAAWERPGGFGGHDIWVSQWTGSAWGTPSPLGSDLNDTLNQYTGSITADAARMYLAIEGDIYVSNDVGGVWQAPVSLGPAVNAPDRWDTNPLISPDGNSLIFSSEREGGYGGYDLYVSAYVMDVQPPQVTVLAPNGGEELCTGYTNDILWTASDGGGVDSVTISLSVNGGVDYTVIARGLPNSGSWPWGIPAVESGQCLVKVEAYDPSLNVGEDTSDTLFTIGLCTGVEEADRALAYRLLPPTPNPVNPSTLLRFELGAPERVDLRVLDVAGRTVAMLADRPYPAGRHAIVWNGTDHRGVPVASGVYFARIRTQSFEGTRRVVVLR